MSFCLQPIFGCIVGQQSDPPASASQPCQLTPLSLTFDPQAASAPWRRAWPGSLPRCTVSSSSTSAPSARSYPSKPSGSPGRAATARRPRAPRTTYSSPCSPCTASPTPGSAGTASSPFWRLQGRGRALTLPLQGAAANFYLKRTP